MITRVERCPACGGSNPAVVVVLDETRKERYLEYSWIKYAGFLDDWLEQLELVIDCCSSCGHHWYRDQPDEAMLSAMYAKGRPLRPQKGASDRTATSTMVWEMRRLKKVLGMTQPSLLDYGSGFGRWARSGVEAGFEVTAFEPSLERGAEFDDVVFNVVHELDGLSGQQFNTINLEQVLEHLPDPISILRKISMYCVNGSLVRITVPNILRCPEGNELWDEWPFNGKRAHTMAPFEHLHGFTPRSLLLMVERAEFVPVSGLHMWRTYPIEKSRALIGHVFPGLGQTWMIAKVKCL